MTLSDFNQGTDGVPEPIARIAATMAGSAFTWHLCGGWAVDAWLGRQTREHSDIDIAVFVDELDAVAAHFPEWQLIAHDQVEPDATAPWTGRQLEFPAHIHARLKDGTPPNLEFCINERAGPEWVLAEEPGVTRELSQCGYASSWGLPVLRPEVVLFYKAKDLRPQDEEDFQALLPHMDADQLDWLARAIAAVTPAHAWLAQMAH